MTPSFFLRKTGRSITAKEKSQVLSNRLLRNMASSRERANRSQRSSKHTTPSLSTKGFITPFLKESTCHLERNPLLTTFLHHHHCDPLWQIEKVFNPPKEHHAVEKLFHFPLRQTEIVREEG